MSSTKIAMGLIDPDNHQKGSVGYNTPPSNSSSSISTISSLASSGTGSKRRRISDTSLDPLDGSLKCRLNHSVDHWPSKATLEPSSKSKPACQLHRWACGHKVRKRRNVVYCQECDVNLCTDQCYRLFHTKWDIVAAKDEIRDELNK